MKRSPPAPPLPASGTSSSLARARSTTRSRCCCARSRARSRAAVVGDEVERASLAFRALVRYTTCVQFLDGRELSARTVGDAALSLVCSVLASGAIGAGAALLARVFFRALQPRWHGARAECVLFLCFALAPYFLGDRLAAARASPPLLGAGVVALVVGGTLLRFFVEPSLHAQTRAQARAPRGSLSALSRETDACGLRVVVPCEKYTRPAVAVDPSA